MSETICRMTIIAAALAFLAVFALVVMPPPVAGPDIVGAFTAGFVNPYISGYSAATLACWVILAAWIVYERQTPGIRRGWACIALGMIPGVATGFALYLLMRMRQV